VGLVIRARCKEAYSSSERYPVTKRENCLVSTKVYVQRHYTSVPYNVNRREKSRAGLYVVSFFVQHRCISTDPRGNSRVAASRSQTVTLKRGKNIKYLPYAFTEHGAIMAATVLSSARAVPMSVFVVRALLRLRLMVTAHKELAAKLSELERAIADQDGRINALFQAVRQLMMPPEPSKRKIGFLVKERAARYGRG
jgi:hypothetical protein